MEQVWALLGSRLCFLQAFDVGVDQVEGDRVACAGILVADRQAGACRDVGVAEGDAGEVEALPGDLLLVSLLDHVHGVLVGELDDLGDLPCDPGLGRLDAVPHDQVAAERLLEQERRAHVLELVEGLGHLQPLAHRLVSGLKVDQGQREEAP